jgi:hypothetical protein
LVKIDFSGFAKIKMEKRQKVAYKTLSRKLKTDYTNPTKSGGELYKWHQKLGMNSTSGTKNWG